MSTTPIQSPKKAFAAFWRKIPRYTWVTFISAFIIGFLAHGYKLTNFLLNHDNTIYDHFLWTSTQGRWFAFFPSAISGAFSLPLVNGVLAIFYIAVSACIVARGLRIRAPLHCVLLAGIMVAFPTVTGTFAYLSYMDCMMFALLLSCLAVCVAGQGRPFGIILGGVLLACGLGLYQSYITTAAAFAVGVLICDILDKQPPWRQTLVKGFKLLGTLALGLVLYFVMVWLTTRDVGLDAYQNLDSMGRLAFSDILPRLRQSLGGIYRFFFAAGQGMQPSYVSWLYVVFFAASAILGARVLWALRPKLKRAQMILLTGLLLAYIVACGSVYLMGAANTYVNMQYAFAMFPIACLAILERLDLKSPKPAVVLQWVCVLALAAVLHSYVLLANTVYLKMQLVHNQAYAYSVELVSRIHDTEGYATGTPVLFAGLPGQTIQTIAAFEEIQGISGAQSNMPASYSYRGYMEFFLGAVLPQPDLSEDALQAMYQKPEFVDMPAYPSPGSTKMLDGVLVVKF